MAFEDNNDKSFFRFEDLRVYHKALDFSQWLFENTRDFNDKDFAEEFNSISRKIAIQIAEGSARKKNQFSFYLKMAKSTTRECLVYTTMAGQYNLLTNIQVEESRDQLMGLTKMLGALIGSLQKQRNSSRNNHEMNHRTDNLKFEEILSGDLDEFEDLID